MRFSEAWLREWVNPDITTEQLAEQLTMAGLEVDAVEPAAPAFSGVRVGHVLDVQPHPDAAKLRVCKVDVGEVEPLVIVCGAANVARDMRVPVVTIGGVLPGDFRIKRAKLRGVESFGMICSAAELGLAETSEGIMPLPQDAPVGADFRAYLDLDDTCIEVDLTPNRGDCLSIAGMAREVGVLNSAALTLPPIPPVPPANDATFAVMLEAPNACPRYVCRIIKGIDASAVTPQWMRERLRRSGLRSLGPVVDVTNYVLLEFGQPMHGFDLGCVQGEIRVRMGEPGERLKLLNGEEIELQDGALVIADAKTPLALAGIMGGESSAVTATTTDVLLESAFFSPTAIIGKARSYGLHTDSSHRFERGVDPELQVRAMERATALLLGIVGGAAGPVVEVVGEGFTTTRPAVRLRRQRLVRVLGVEVDDPTVEDILSRLGMRVEADSEGWLVVPPTARFDVACEEDLIEEVGRIYGYDRIPATAGSSGISITTVPESAFDLGRAKQLLVARDYQEVITYSFIAPELASAMVPESEPIRLANPLSADMAVMRPSLWSGLIETAKYNRARQQERIRIFESGLKFVSDGIEIKQENVICGLALGEALEEQWALPARAVDFFDLKADVEALLALAAVPEEFSFVAAEHPALHPGQSARIVRGEREAGWLGLIHPRLEKALDIGKKTYVFELGLSEMNQGRLPAFVPISRFPAIRRDLAVVVDRQVPFSRLQVCVEAAAPEIVRDIRLFDVYTGQNIESNRKSLALSLILQDYSRTLTDDDVTKATAAVLEALEKELDAKLRE